MKLTKNRDNITVDQTGSNKMRTRWKK